MAAKAAVAKKPSRPRPTSPFPARLLTDDDESTYDDGLVLRAAIFLRLFLSA
jgi:hypothetical protein